MNKRTMAISGAFVVLAGASVGLAAAVHAGPFAQPEASASTAPEDLGPVIATVDGQPIYLGEMRSRVQGIQQVHGDFEKMFGKDWKHELLQNLVDDKIVEEQAAARGITISEDQIAAHVAELRSNFPTEQAFQEWLSSGRMTESELASRIRLQTIASELYLKVTSDVTVTSAQMRTYYDRHGDRFPGVDGSGAPFLAVRAEIKQDLEKRARDTAYGAWLDAQRRDVQVVVVMPDWWKEIA
ncbi:MAG: SurA N-terminal domain-containing protein [Actinomycetota bacterium]